VASRPIKHSMRKKRSPITNRLYRADSIKIFNSTQIPKALNIDRLPSAASVQGLIEAINQLIQTTVQHPEGTIVVFLMVLMASYIVLEICRVMKARP
jgi:hypothetical protein